jgi:hypothetical protein
LLFPSEIQCENICLAKLLSLMNRNARKEKLRLTPFRDTTTQYNSPQYTAALRILHGILPRIARSAADTVERTAEQHWWLSALTQLMLLTHSFRDDDCKT